MSVKTTTPNYTTMADLEEGEPWWSMAYIHISHSFNILRPRQNGRHVPDDIFKLISFAIEMF